MIICGSCNFENLKNINRAHILRNALVFIRFSILIYPAQFSLSFTDECLQLIPVN